MFKVRADYDEYQNKTFRIPSELVQELEMVAQANNISVNKLVIQSLQYALDNLDEGSKSGKQYSVHIVNKMAGVQTFSYFYIVGK